MSFTSRFAFVLFLLAGAFMVFRSIQDLKTHFGPNRWRETDGTVLGTSVSTKQEVIGEGPYYDALDQEMRYGDAPGGRAREESVFVLEVTYSYDVAGKRWEDTVEFGDFPTAVDALNTVGAKYERGASILVLYDPQNPSVNSVETVPQRVESRIVFLLVGLLFMSLLPGGEYVARSWKAVSD